MLESAFPNEIPITLRRTWLLVNEPQTYTAGLRARFGEVVTFLTKGKGTFTSMEGQAFVLALSSEGARQVLLGDAAGYDAFWKRSFRGIAGTGSLWVLEGNAHRRERQLLSPAFHAHGFQGYGETIREVTRQKMEAWQPGGTQKALDMTLAISLDVIMRLVFGVDDEELFQEGRRVLRNLWRTLHPMVVFFPGLQRRWFPPWRRYQRAKVDFSNWMDRYLIERRARREETEDVLGRMLTAKYDDGSPMRDEDIRDEMITILMAGNETTATAMAWALYELGRHPAEMEKLRAELDPLGPDPDPGSVVKLPYLNAVCNETLRLHTLLPEVGRVLAAPLELFGYTIPAGESVGVSIMAIHHDPGLYPEPDRFIPVRFIGRTYSQFEFLPFGGGHRRCLGSALSDYEMRIALAEIVSCWDFESSAVEREIRHDIAMGPKKGVPLRILGRRTLHEN